MQRVCYHVEKFGFFFKGEWKEKQRLYRHLVISLAGRLRVRRVLALAGFAGLLAALWWLGHLGPEAMLGLVVVGAIWGGDKGSGSGETPRRQDSMLSFLDRLFMRHRPRWLPTEVRGDVAPGVPEVADTDEDALAEELLGQGLDELGRFVSRAVGWMKDLQGVMWDWERPRAERHQASAEARAIHDVALDSAKRGQGALADVAQGRRSVGEGLQELFEATDPLPLA
jgi:hypothetical protein